MKFLYLITFVFLFNANAMVLIEITDEPMINYYASIMINLTAIIAPLFGALSLTRH